MYEQLDIFSMIPTEPPRKFHPIEEFALHSGNRENIIRFFSTNSDLDARIEFLKNEYAGGFLFQTDNPFVVYSGNATEKGCEMEYFDHNMELIKLKISYAGLAKTIDKMVREGRF